MSAPGLLGQWCGMVYSKEIGFRAVIQECHRYGVPLDRARDIAEDAVQAALVQAAKVPDIETRFSGGFDHFCCWLQRVAINYVRQVFRRERRKRSLKNEAEIPAVESVPAHVEAVRDFLGMLTDEERALLMGPYEEDLKLDELARRYLPPDDRTENARRLRIRQRLRKLQERFRGWMEEQGLGPPGDSNRKVGVRDAHVAG